LKKKTVVFSKIPIGQVSSISRFLSEWRFSKDKKNRENKITIAKKSDFFNFNFFIPAKPVFCSIYYTKKKEKGSFYI